MYKRQIDRDYFLNKDFENIYKSLYIEYIKTIVSNYGHNHYPNPLFLTTINNLQSSVTKDNTLTMKVTYTLNGTKIYLEHMIKIQK